MLYRQWPATFWQDANTLVTLAQTTSTGRSSTLPGIIHQYTHLCAFFILANNKHHATDLQGLFGVLSEQPLALKFERKPTGTRLDHYCVGAANPPTPVCFTQSINTDNLQYFCVGPLYQQLQSLQPGSHSAADNMIRYRPTRHGSKRATARATRNNPLKAVVGVMEIHKNINSMPQTENINSQFTNPLELVTTDRLQQKSQYSLFNQIHVNSDSTEFIVENQSRSGFGMRLGNNRNSVNNKVQVGELFAHCYGDTSEEINWHLGSIRWLKTDSDETLRFGVETISKHTSAVEVLRFPHNTKRSTATCKGLLASYQPMDCEVTQLLLPAHTCKPGEIMSFKDRRRNRTVKLVEIVSVNNLYQSFAIKTVDARAKDHGSITTKPSNILKLPLAAAPLVLSR